jgi:dethiobiotin synthetase
MSSPAPSAGKCSENVIFITGTGTGVGKTLLAGLLLFHLRQSGCHALAMKPFCCGSTSDIRLLHALQDGELRPGEINPFYFSEPVAPLVAARMHRRRIELEDVIQRIREVAARCERLIVEGCGGLLVPLGGHYTLADLIARLNGSVIVVSQNRLGTINHTLLTVEALRRIGMTGIRVALMDGKSADFSSRSNQQVLSELICPVNVLRMKYLGVNAWHAGAVKENCRKVKKTLAQLVGADNFCHVLSGVERRDCGKKHC